MTFLITRTWLVKLISHPMAIAELSYRPFNFTDSSLRQALQFASLFNEGQLLKEKNLLLSFKCRPYLRKEAMRNLQRLFHLSRQS